LRLARHDDLSTNAKSVLVFFLSLTMLLASACGPSRVATPMSRPEQPLQEINSQSVELERDDLSRELLVQAVQNSLLYYERLPGDRLVKFGPEEIPVSRMKRTLEFLDGTCGQSPREIHNLPFRGSEC
jgi:hypothetical protein